MDKSFIEEGSGTRMVIISPGNHRMHCALWFEFKALINETEYEAFLARLQLLAKMKVKNSKFFYDL